MSSSAKRHQDKPKLTVRLLPPALTADEFKSILGSEWDVGSGKIDWFDFSNGKVSSSPAKYSRPSTAWLRLTNISYIPLLEEKLRQSTFTDSKNTQNDAFFPQGPLLEYAINQKTPSNRKRVDPRMGTIDQDPDFKKFLESLTNPIQKPSVDLEASLNQSAPLATTTPLIEHIRAKKASKEAKAKGVKDSREGGKGKRRGKDTTSTTNSSEKPKKVTKSDRLLKPTPKVLTRQPNNDTSSSKDVPAQPAPSRSERSERPNSRRGPSGAFNIAAKIQKDLGLAPPTPRRTGNRQDTSSTTPAISTTSASPSAPSAPSKPATSTTSTSNQDTKPVVPEPRKNNSRSNRRGTGPKEQKQQKQQKEQKESTSPQQHASSLKQPINSSDSTATPETIAATSKQKSSITSKNINPTLRVFLKHANASQGITEALLHTSLSTAYGSVTNVEIDRRKGIAYADFSDVTGVQNAIKSGRLEIAKGAVQILPYRERQTQPSNRGGGNGRGRGGSGT